MKFLKNLLQGDAREENAPEDASSPAQITQSHTPIEVGADFAALELPEELNRAIADLGFENCTPVQK